MQTSGQAKRFVCKQNMCNGCMACLHVCEKDAITICDDPKAYNAVIDEGKCVNCRRCERVCPRQTMVESHRPILWVQGWAKDNAVRRAGSSGGYATAIMRAFITKLKGSVVSCVYQDGAFGFAVANTADECFRFCGSKYVKSNPALAYEPIQTLLREDKKVLFLGLPCQVAGVKNAIPAAFEDNFYSVDLICHGTPSPQLLDRYLQEDHRKSIKDMPVIAFRNKTNYRLSQGEAGALMPAGVQDRYTMAFLNSLDYTENCYNCDYAKVERVSDITLGDSWASGMPESDIRQGISLALCQTEKGKQLLELADIEMRPVDVDAAIAANRQLRTPSIAPRQSKRFWESLEKGRSFGSAVFAAYPKICLKQDIKALLVKTGLRKKT